MTSSRYRRSSRPTWSPPPWPPRRTRDCRRATGPTSTSSPSTRRTRWTWTRRCTSSGRRSGFTVHYAIADVAAFVQPGDPIDFEARRRGETLYAPDRRTPLHPPELSEGAASLLPDQVRPALLWTIAVDSSGEGTEVDVRARAGAVPGEAELRRRAEGPGRRYGAGVAAAAPRGRQAAGDSGNASAAASTCRSRTRRSSPATARWTLEFRAPLPVEGWNAQISLLTGMAAASLMMKGEIGILRTLPESSDGFRRRAGEHREGARHPVAGRDCRTRSSSTAWIPRCRRTRRCWRPARCCSAAPATRRSPGRCRSSPSMPR